MFPKSVNIKGSKYKILHIELPSSVMGGCNSENKTICICSVKNKTILESLGTYSHELTHAYISEFNLDAVIPDEIEELICIMIEDVAQSLVPFIIKHKNKLKGE